MNRSPSPVAEIVVPVSVFGVLRRELVEEVGMLPAVHALHNAGYAAGTDAGRTLFDPSASDLDEMSASAFWDRVASYFGKRGWGTPRHESPHRGVGLITSTDWVEATPDAIDPEASCSFTTGFLSGLLSAAADGPVAVLEVSCRTRGDDACQFAFGSAAVIHDLYGHLLEGRELQPALQAL